MKPLPLTKGKVALVDDEDFAAISKYKWYAERRKHTYYAYRRDRVTRKVVRMHREILKPRKGQVIDHKNHNGLDNRRSNIRLCTYANNAQNSRRKRGVSGFRGVWPHPSGIWHVYIQCRGVATFLGCFHDPAEGAKAYDKAAKRLHGTFAILNFPSAHP